MLPEQVSAVAHPSSKPGLAWALKVRIVAYWFQAALQLRWYLLARVGEPYAAFAEPFAAGQKLNHNPLRALCRDHTQDRNGLSP